MRKPKTACPLTRFPPRGEEKRGRVKPTPDLWYWLWRSYYVTATLWDELSRHTGVDRDRVKPTFDLCMCNRLLYPDGTIPGFVDEFARLEMGKRYGKMRIAYDKPGKEG